MTRMFVEAFCIAVGLGGLVAVVAVVVRVPL